MPGVLEFGAQTVTQVTFHELATGIPGQGIRDEPDIAGHFVLCHGGCTVGPEFVSGQFFAWLQDDGDTYFFSQPIVRDAKHTALGHCRMSISNRFHFGAVDVFAAAKDHVLFAVDDIDEPVLVDPGDIAGVGN